MESRCWTPSSSGFSPTHQRYWSYLDLLVENNWLLSQQGGTFLCQSATNHTSLRIAWEDEQVITTIFGKFEKNPEAWKTALKEELAKADVGNDPQIIETAQ